MRANRMNRPKKGAVGKATKHMKPVDKTKHPYSDKDSLPVMGKRMGSSGAKMREKRLAGKAM